MNLTKSLHYRKHCDFDGILNIRVLIQLNNTFDNLRIIGLAICSNFPF